MCSRAPHTFAPSRQVAEKGDGTLGIERTVLMAPEVRRLQVGKHNHQSTFLEWLATHDTATAVVNPDTALLQRHVPAHRIRHGILHRRRLHAHKLVVQF